MFSLKASEIQLKLTLKKIKKVHIIEKFQDRSTSLVARSWAQEEVAGLCDSPVLALLHSGLAVFSGGLSPLVARGSSRLMAS